MTEPQLEFDFSGPQSPTLATPRVGHAEPRAAFQRSEKTAAPVAGLPTVAEELTQHWKRAQG